MGFLEKGLLIYLMLAIAVSCWAPQIVFDGNSASDATVLGWFQIIKDENNTIMYNNLNNNTFNGTNQGKIANLTILTQAPTGTGYIGFIDPLLHVFGWIGTILSVIFSPIIIFTSPEMIDAPIALLLIIGLPMVLLFLIGLLGWIRSGEM